MEFPGRRPRSAWAAAKRLEPQNTAGGAAPRQAAAIAGRGIETRYLPILCFAQRGIRRPQLPIRLGNMCEGEAGKSEGQALAHRFQHGLLGAPQSNEGLIAGTGIECRERLSFPGIEKTPGDFKRAQICSKPLDV